MVKNNRTKILKEETVSQITINDLLDLGTKAQIAVIQLSDQCMKFDNPHLKKISAEANKQIAILCDEIKSLFISNQNDSSMDGGKSPLDGLEDTIKDPERNNKHNNVIESKGKKSKLLIKKLLEALEEATNDDDDSTNDTDIKTASNINDSDATETPAIKQIDLSAPFTSIIEGLTDDQFISFKSSVVDSLKGSGVVDPAFQEIVNNIENSTSIDDFNFALDSLYDYADENGLEVITEPNSTKEEETNEE